MDYLSAKLLHQCLAVNSFPWPRLTAHRLQEFDHEARKGLQVKSQIQKRINCRSMPISFGKFSIPVSLKRRTFQRLVDSRLRKGKEAHGGCQASTSRSFRESLSIAEGPRECQMNYSYSFFYYSSRLVHGKIVHQS